MHAAPRPNYWCIVAVPYDGSDPVIVARSPDAITDELIEYSFISDNLDASCMKGQQPGLYRLGLSFKDDDTSIESIDVILFFPQLDVVVPSATSKMTSPISKSIVSDYTGILRRMEQIQREEKSHR